MSLISTNLTVPYWAICNSNSFKMLKEKEFRLRFEQVGMSLKRNHIFTELNTLS